MEPAHLRIYCPDTNAPTLADILPEIASHNNWSRRTLAEYQSTVALWTRLSGDPPIDAITDADIRRFTEALAAPGPKGQLSPNTIRKHLRQLRALLRDIGPGTPTHYIDAIPHVPLPPPQRHPPVAWTPHELARLAAATPYFQPGYVTDGILPDRWWRALLRLLWNTALRIGTALALQWEWLQPDGWIAVPASAMKGRRIGRRFYLNTLTRDDLLACRTKTTGPILPWNAATVTLERWRVRLQRAAGLPTDDRHGFHAIRRASLSAIARLNPIAARIVAGHAAGDVLLEYYITEDLIAETLEKLPQPF